MQKSGKLGAGSADLAVRGCLLSVSTHVTTDLQCLGGNVPTTSLGTVCVT